MSEHDQHDVDPETGEILESEPAETPFEAPEPAPEQAEEAEAEEAEAEEAPAEPQGASPEEWEQRFKKSDQAFARYEKSVRGYYGDDADALVVIAISPGAPPGFVNVNDAGRVPDEFKLPVMEFFGITREQDYADDPYTSACDTCKGKGATRTGSSVPGNEKRVCPTCAGRGYMVEGQQVENGHAATDAATLSVASPMADFERENRDNWGEPMILPDGRPNPNYGRQPQFKELVEPWGVTAGLGAQDAASVDAPA